MSYLKIIDSKQVTECIATCSIARASPLHLKIPLMNSSCVTCVANHVRFWALYCGVTCRDVFGLWLAFAMQKETHCPRAKCQPLRPHCLASEIRLFLAELSCNGHGIARGAGRARASNSNNRNSHTSTTSTKSNTNTHQHRSPAAPPTPTASKTPTTSTTQTEPTPTDQQ